MTTTTTAPTASDASAVLLGLYRSQVEQANVHADRCAAQNVGKMVHDKRDDPDTTDEKVKAFQEWYEKANAAIEAKTAEIDEYIKSTLPTGDVDVDAEKEAYNALKASIVGGKAVLRQLGVEIPEEFPALKNLRGGSTGAGGSTGPKPRVALITINGDPVQVEKKIVKNGVDTGETKLVSNFTYAAQELSKRSGGKVTSKDLQSATFDAAKTTDLKSLKPGTEISFSFSAGKDAESSKNYTVNVYTQDSDA